MAGTFWRSLSDLNSLTFDSLEFLFVFLPVLLVVFWMIPEKCRSSFLFLGSLFLYGLAQPLYLPLLFAMTFFSYASARAVESRQIRQEILYNAARARRKKTSKRPMQRAGKGVVMAAVAFHTLLLVFCKSAGLFVGGWMLPLGISFYLFKSISYLVDVYRQEIPVEHDFCRFGAYMCFFPQIVSGPIMRYRTDQMNLAEKQFSPVLLEEGLKKVILGLASKVLLADRFAILWHDMQTVGFESISAPLAWLGALAYSLRIYFDFAGYSLIAVGIGQMFGVSPIKNFDRPYSAKTVSEFYRRWHITLGQWFRDYVYIPFGGSRGTRLSTVRNLLIVWFLTGFWHGGSLNYLLWGISLGFLIVLEKAFYGKWLNKHKIISRIYLWFFIMLSWVIFAIPDFGDMKLYFARLFPFFGVGTAINAGDFWKELRLFAPELLTGLLLCIPAAERTYKRFKKNRLVTAGLFVLFWYTIYKITVSAANPFMYAVF